MRPMEMKPHEISHVSLNLGAQVGIQDALVWTRIIPTGQAGKEVFARTLLPDEPDPGIKVLLFPYLGESLVFRPRNLKVYLKDVDRLYERNDEGYAPIADLLWLWMKIGIPSHGNPPNAEAYRYLFAAGRRLDVAQQLRADALTRLRGEHKTLFSYRNALFATLGIVETMCVSFGRAVEMVSEAPSVVGQQVPLPHRMLSARNALLEIRNSFEHIEDRAKGQVRNKPHPDATSIFDQRDLFTSGDIRYGNHKINIYGEMAAILLEARATLFSLAEKASGDGIQNEKELRFFGGASLADYERIKERAYRLWRDRTGSKWWDAEANWFEAEQLESEHSAPAQSNAG